MRVRLPLIQIKTRPARFGHVSGQWTVEVSRTAVAKPASDDATHGILATLTIPTLLSH
jgi:hypothetical protein